MYVPDTPTTHSSSSQLPLEKLNSEGSLNCLLSSYASTVIDEFRDVWIFVEKYRVWQRAIHFYKSAKARPEKLRGQLAVEYAECTRSNLQESKMQKCKNFLGEHAPRPP